MALIAFARRHRRFVAFCAVGGSGVVVNMVIFAVALQLWPREPGSTRAAGALAINVAGLLGWLVSVSTNYLLNERLTFADRKADFASHWSRRLTRYYISATAALAVQLVVLNGGLALLSATGILDAAGRLAAGASRLDVMADLIASGEILILGRALLQAFAAEICNLAGIATGTVANYLLAKRWVFR